MTTKPTKDGTLDLYGVRVQVGDYTHIKALADTILGYTYADIPKRKAQKASVYKAASLHMELKAWGREVAK